MRVSACATLTASNDGRPTMIPKQTTARTMATARMAHCRNLFFFPPLSPIVLTIHLPALFQEPLGIHPSNCPFHGLFRCVFGEVTDQIAGLGNIRAHGRLEMPVVANIRHDFFFKFIPIYKFNGNLNAMDIGIGIDKFDRSQGVSGADVEDLARGILPFLNGTEETTRNIFRIAWSDRVVARRRQYYRFPLFVRQMGLDASSAAAIERNFIRAADVGRHDCGKSYAVSFRLKFNGKQLRITLGVTAERTRSLGDGWRRHNSRESKHPDRTADNHVPYRVFDCRV